LFVVQKNLYKPDALPVTQQTLSQSTDGNSKQQQLECGPMPNVMAALQNTGGALCSMPQSVADAHY